MTTPNPTPIAELVSRRESLARQVATLNTELEKIDRELFGRLQAALDAFGLTRPPIPSLPPLPPSPPTMPARVVDGVLTLTPSDQAPRSRQGDVGGMIERHVEAELRKLGRPMKIREIFDSLNDAGIQIPGKVPMNNLSAHLSRSKKFVRQGEGWWFQ
jgi:hypothetical protein